MNALINRRTALKTLITGGALAAIPTVGGLRAESTRENGPVLSAETNGVPNDGETPASVPLQALLDKLAANGGGMAVLPAGRYLLEKTVLIPSRVHLVGEGISTVLTGGRPDGVNGLALLANAGITTARGYDGADGFSVQNLALDTPRTNGIVLVHARNARFSHIYGLDAFHHHFDIAGSQNILCDNLHLTGRSGTAPFQIDGSPYNNNIWDGEQRVAPIRDETPNDGIFLSQSVIRPTNRPNHGIHLHRRGGKNIFIDNVLVENVENGVYRDPNCSREDVVMSNLIIRNVSNRGILFRPSTRKDLRVSFRNITVTGAPAAVECHASRDLEWDGLHTDEISGEGAHVTLNDIDGGSLNGLVCRGGEQGQNQAAVALVQCQNLFVSRLRARGLGLALRMEESANLQTSGLMTTDADGQPIPPVIMGEEALAPWRAS